MLKCWIVNEDRSIVYKMNKRRRLLFSTSFTIRKAYAIDLSRSALQLINVSFCTLLFCGIFRLFFSSFSRKFVGAAAVDGQKSKWSSNRIDWSIFYCSGFSFGLRIERVCVCVWMCILKRTYAPTLIHFSDCVTIENIDAEHTDDSIDLIKQAL